MTDPPISTDTSAGARLMTDALAPLYGLKVDATRAAELQPLVEKLLRHGAQLTQSTPPDLEPYFVRPPSRAAQK